MYLKKGCEGTDWIELKKTYVQW